MSAAQHGDGFESEKVPVDFADLFYHQTLDGTPPTGLSNEEYDRQKADMQAAGTWPFDDRSDDEEPGAVGYKPDWA